jgi:hypothetical protein
MKILAMLTGSAALGFANTNAGRKLFMCTTPQPAALTQVAYAALVWLEIKGVGSLGETGSKTNILSYDTWGDDVIQKAKGMTDAGSPEIESAYDPDDAGQNALRAAALTNLNYAFRVDGNDQPNTNVGSKPTIRYNRGLVSGPTQPNGRNEDFVVEKFTLGLQQRQITVPPVTV